MSRLKKNCTNILKKKRESSAVAIAIAGSRYGGLFLKEPRDTISVEENAISICTLSGDKASCPISITKTSEIKRTLFNQFKE